jgi:hypothetical protein
MADYFNVSPSGSRRVVKLYSLLTHGLRFTLAAGLGMAGLTMARVSLAQTVIFSDTFSGTNGAANTGRTPDTTDLFGVNWQLTGNGGGSISTGTLQMLGANGATLSLASTVLYNKPTQMTISALLKPNNMLAGAGRGIGIGFWKALHPGSGSVTDFYGLMLDQTGILAIEGNSTVFESVAWAGPAFSASQFYQVSYSIDTATGAISNVSMAGSTANYSAINNDTNGLFTDINTAYAGIRAQGASGTGFADNFILSGNTQAAGTPEPGAISLLVSGLAIPGTMLLRRRRRG